VEGTDLERRGRLELRHHRRQSLGQHVLADTWINTLTAPAAAWPRTMTKADEIMEQTRRVRP
jgi:hypothetical protein